MKTKLFALAAALGFTMGVVAQNSVSVDAGGNWLGYANIFDPATGNYVFGESWGVPDIKTVVDAGAGTLTLQPNFNTYAANPTDPFWVDQTTGLGAKIFEGNSYIEDNSLAGVELTFSGNVNSNTLDGAYDALAFIKVFNANYSVLKIATAPLTGANFEVVFTDVNPAEDAVVQYGFQIIGLNANPDDEATLGSVVVSGGALSVNDFNTASFSVAPNPSNSVWNVRSAQYDMTQVVLFDVLGKKVAQFNNPGTALAIDNSNLSKGAYFAQINTASGSTTVQLMKN
ncbi:MAG: T9SS type A sorting domain-containing protein [Flavobacteriaceae bacterium]|nr:T9SS type A sorting domain-containing protein [Flavobacteriaceae bacterium]